MERRIIRARGAAVRRRHFLVVAFLVPFARAVWHSRGLSAPRRTSRLSGFSILST